MKLQASPSIALVLVALVSPVGVAGVAKPDGVMLNKTMQTTANVFILDEKSRYLQRLQVELVSNCILDAAGFIAS
jgi:hypothetical protein